MKPLLLSLASLWVLVLVLALAVGPAQAAFPDKPIKPVVAFAPASSTRRCIEGEVAKWGKLVKDMGVKVE